ncbi:MAG: hypothetical protein RI531_09350, partial [Haloferacaceae archaeon]|nr:hypothetical protein [Haloferacaceae archaeon]
VTVTILETLGEFEFIPAEAGDAVERGETHAHTTATVDGTHLVSAGATAPLKRGVEPSVELLQVGYGTVVCERIMLGETPG